MKEITALINQVETAASLRIETVRAAIKQHQAARRDQLEANTYAEIANAKVRVIPLRFASVGETTRQFHGRSVTVPGISDSLKTIISDLNIGGGGDSAAARSGGNFAWVAAAGALTTASNVSR